MPRWASRTRMWPEPRRKRTYVNQVLARAEVHSTYQPARRLWVRAKNGHCFPDPQMQLRVDEGWQPAYDRLALEWIDRGCGGDIDHLPGPVMSIQWVHQALERTAQPGPPPDDPDAQQPLT